MLLVKDSMTREIVTLAPDETAATALALCRERRIRHLPVLTGREARRDRLGQGPALRDPRVRRPRTGRGPAEDPG